MPIEPPVTCWMLPPPESAERSGVVGIGADLEPGTILAAYRRGLFPMRVESGGPIAWWSPDPRGVLPLDGLIVSRSLRRSLLRYTIRIDTAFERVMRECAAPDRPYGWIDDSFVEAYGRLHALGWAHSVEAWLGDALVGGLYGVAIGGFFAGESMFHREQRRVEGGARGARHRVEGEGGIALRRAVGHPPSEVAGSRRDPEVRVPGPTRESGRRNSLRRHAALPLPRWVGCTRLCGTSDPSRWSRAGWRPRWVGCTHLCGRSDPSRRVGGGSRAGRGRGAASPARRGDGYARDDPVNPATSQRSAAVGTPRLRRERCEQSEERHRGPSDSR